LFNENEVYKNTSCTSWAVLFKNVVAIEKGELLLFVFDIVGILPQFLPYHFIVALFIRLEQVICIGKNIRNEYGTQFFFNN